MILPPLIRRLSAADLAAAHSMNLLHGVYRVDHEDYHDGPGTSSTTIKKALKSAAHTRIPMEDTDALVFGRALHTKMLEPELFDSVVTVWRGGRRQGKAWDLFEAESIGLDIITEADEEAILAIVERAEASAIWQGLRRDAEVEVAAYARCPVSGLLLKAKCDVFSGTDYIVDWKTTQSADPDAFERTIRDYDYHVSAAQYLDVFERAIGERPRGFIWAAAEKKKPHGIRFFVATDNMIEIGRAEYQKAAALLSGCEKTGVYPCYPDEITPIEFQPFFLRKYGL